MSEQTPLFDARQQEFLTLDETIVYCRPWSESDFWKRLKRHPGFPLPARGGPGRRQLYAKKRIDEFLAKLANETGLA